MYYSLVQYISFHGNFIIKNRKKKKTRDGEKHKEEHEKVNMKEFSTKKI